MVVPGAGAHSVAPDWPEQRNFTSSLHQLSTSDFFHLTSPTASTGHSILELRPQIAFRYSPLSRQIATNTMQPTLARMVWDTPFNLPCTELILMDSRLVEDTWERMDEVE